jgi:hypothetical protein
MRLGRSVSRQFLCARICRLFATRVLRTKPLGSRARRGVFNGDIVVIEYQTAELVPGSEAYHRTAAFLRTQGQANLEEAAIADPGRLGWCESAVMANCAEEVVGVALIADPGMPHPKQPAVDLIYVAKDYRNRKEFRVGSNLFERAVRSLMDRFPNLRIYCPATDPVLQRIIDQAPAELRSRVDVVDVWNQPLVPELVVRAFLRRGKRTT